MNALATFWAIIIVWVFQAGVTYAGFTVLKNQMAETMRWQKEHEKQDNARFFMVVGMVATYFPKDDKEEILSVIRDFAKL